MKNIDVLSCSSIIIDFLSDLSDTIQNLWWLVIVMVTIFGLIVSLFSIRKKANKFTKEQITHQMKDEKYIPGVFVELNESKEMLRYFIYSKKWKKRLVQNFNFVYDNAYGDILKKAYNDSNVFYWLSRKTSMKKIEQATETALALHDNFSSSTVKFKSGYEESQVLFEILRYPYTDMLGDIYLCSKAANRRYFILTGSAGNGKTNLLCSISELLLNLKEAVVFLNARDIEGDVLEFLLCKLKLPNIYKKHKDIYLYLVNLLLTIQHKHLFIIVDAINENDNEDFGEKIALFINKIARYSRVKIIVSCRNEYYKDRFRKCLVRKVDMPAFEFDLRDQHYTLAAINQIIRAYSKYFNYSGNISPSVRNILSKQLLLLRIFFEVNKDSNTDIFSIRKHEIYFQYIEVIKQNHGEYIVKVLDAITDFMIENENYDEISLPDLERVGIAPDMIKKIVDSSILLSKKLISHEGTIARNENEVVYFVFDELRDYYIARRILLNNVSVDNVDGESVFEKLKQLKTSGASCAEGVIHYCYVFFRTDEVVAKLDQTEKICKSILDLYRIPEDREKKSYWHMHHRKEFQNLGLRIILTSGITLDDFEIAYIQDCLRKDPYEDGGIFFDTMLDGTLYGGIYNLDLYLDILFGIKNEDEILNVFSQISVHNDINKYFIPKNFIKYYNMLSNDDDKLQIQKVAELFLLYFKLHDIDAQNELEVFFYNLPTHAKVQKEMILKMKVTCGLKV